MAGRTKDDYNEIYNFNMPLNVSSLESHYLYEAQLGEKKALFMFNSKVSKSISKLYLRKAMGCS